MKSTGEVMGKDITLEKALYKGLIAAGRKVPLHGAVLFTVADKHKPEAFDLASDLQILATRFMQQTEQLNISKKTEFVLK